MKSILIAAAFMICCHAQSQTTKQSIPSPVPDINAMTLDSLGVYLEQPNVPQLTQKQLDSIYHAYIHGGNITDPNFNLSNNFGTQVSFNRDTLHINNSDGICIIELDGEFYKVVEGEIKPVRIRPNPARFEQLRQLKPVIQTSTIKQKKKP